jgi:molybdenum cofactor cytidylyltransferase
VRATVEAVCGAGCGEIIVVTGHARARIAAALDGLPVRFVFAADFAGGMGHSLAAGARAATANARGFIVTPADLPDLRSEIVRQIVECFVSGRGEYHVIPMASGARGHPVVIGAWLRPQLESLTGDAGARHLLAGPAELPRCCFLEVGHPAILRDVDRL